MGRTSRTFWHIGCGKWRKDRNQGWCLGFWPKLLGKIIRSRAGLVREKVLFFSPNQRPGNFYSKVGHWLQHDLIAVPKFRSLHSQGFGRPASPCRGGVTYTEKNVAFCVVSVFEFHLCHVFLLWPWASYFPFSSHSYRIVMLNMRTSLKDLCEC